MIENGAPETVSTFPWAAPFLACSVCGAHVGWCNPSDPLHQILERHHTSAGVWSELPPGWLPLFDRLLGDIREMGWRGTLGQAKEKWGILCLYLERWGDPCAPDCHANRPYPRDQYGQTVPSAVVDTAPEYVGYWDCICGAVADSNQLYDDLHEAVYARVDAAARESATVCQDCGQPGELGVSGWWYVTVCPAHAEDGWVALRALSEEDREP